MASGNEDERQPGSTNGAEGSGQQGSTNGGGAGGKRPNPMVGSTPSGSTNGAEGSGQPGGAEEVKPGEAVIRPVLDYEGMYNALIGRMAEYKAESEEERKKRERREKRERMLGSIADIGRVMHEAFSHQRGVQPMSMPNLNARMQERIERAKREREANADRWMKYADMATSVRNDQVSQGYKQMALQVRQHEAERRMRESQARIDRLAAQGRVDEARAAMAEAQEEYYRLRAEGVQIDNAWKPRLNQATVDVMEHQANAPYGQGGSSGMGGYTLEERYETDPMTGRRTGRTVTRTPTGTYTGQRGGGGAEGPGGGAGDGTQGREP